MTARFRAAAPVLPEQIVVSSGLTCTAEMVAYTLGNPGDGFLVGRPLYSAFPNDFYARAKVHVVPVGFAATDPFAASCVGFYEAALRKWNAKPGDGRVRALVIVNPHNPLGMCFRHRRGMGS